MTVFCVFVFGVCRFRCTLTLRRFAFRGRWVCRVTLCAFLCIRVCKLMAVWVYTGIVT